MKKTITMFDRKLNGINKRFDRLCNEIEKEAKPLIKREAIKLNRNTFHSQHSFHYYKENRPPVKGFEKLQDFIYQLGDNYHLGLYFECVDNKFTWL